MKEKKYAHLELIIKLGAPQQQQPQQQQGQPPQQQQQQQPTSAIVFDDGQGDDEDEESKSPSQPNKNKHAGRRKIKIEYITDKTRRHITFSKRKAGIMKKVKYSFLL